MFHRAYPFCKWRVLGLMTLAMASVHCVLEAPEKAASYGTVLKRGCCFMWAVNGAVGPCLSLVFHWTNGGITAVAFLYLWLCLGAHVGKKKSHLFLCADSCLALYKSLLLSASFVLIVFWVFFEGLFAFWSGVTKHVCVALFLNSLF